MWQKGLKLFCLAVMGILLIMGCFGISFIVLEEKPTFGKRMVARDLLFDRFRLTTALTPGEPTVTIEKGWIERKRVGLFVIGGYQRLILDCVTIVTPQHPQADLSPQSLSSLLLERKGLGEISLAELRRIELRAAKAEGGEAFFRAARAEVQPGKQRPVVLQNAWFREQGGRWEQLRMACIEQADARSVRLRMARADGSLLSLPLSLSF